MDGPQWTRLVYWFLIALLHLLSIPKNKRRTALFSSVQGHNIFYNDFIIVENFSKYTFFFQYCYYFHKNTEIGYTRESLQSACFDNRKL